MSAVLRTVAGCGLIAATALCLHEATAQTTSASLTGTVRTAEGQPVDDAVVTARSQASGAVRTAVTDAKGEYRFGPLTPGHWTTAARLSNGRLSESQHVTLRLQETVRLDFVVGTGSDGLEERVTVTAQIPLIDRRETAGMLRVSGDTANNLPLSGRTFTDLALLDSSVGQAAPGNFFGERGSVFVVNGQSGRSNSFLVDGLDNNDQTSGTTSNAFYSQQVIQEFVLLTHQYAPEFGRASGGVLNIVTRRGNNESEWEVFVQGSAADWNEAGNFIESLPDTGGSSTANHFFGGFNVGGAFKKDRAFYFLAYEHQESHDPIAYTGVTADGLEGGRYVAPGNDDNLFLRTDFNLSPSQSLMVRLSADDRTTRGVNVGGVFTPDAGFSIEEQDLALAVSLTSVISGRLLNEARLLVADSTFDQLANSSRTGVTRPSGIFGGNTLNVQLRDEFRIQLVENLTIQQGNHTVKLGVDVTRSHTKIRTAFNPEGNFLYNSDAAFDAGDCGNLNLSDFISAEQDGTLPYVPCTFSNGIDDDGDLLIDEPGILTSYPLVYSYIFGRPRATIDDTKYGLFAQDRWEIGRRLILDYGLRFDLSTYTLPREASVDSTVRNGGAERDDDNIAPRLGFTFTPKVDGKLVIRGGGGIFYDKLVLAFPAVAAITSGTRIGLMFPQGFLAEVNEDLVAEQGAGQLLIDLEKQADELEKFIIQFSTETKLDTPYTVQFNLGLERSFGEHQALGANVVRSRGYHLPLMKDLNPVDGLFPVQLQVCNEQTLDPDLEFGLPCHLDDPSIGSIAALTTEGRSWYSALELDWRVQRDGGWMNASYTWSKAEDTGFDPLKGGLSLPPDSRDFSGERGRADGDRRHRFVLSAEFPLRWMDLRASGALQWSTGLPFNVTTGQDDNVDGILTDRPEGIGRNSGEHTDLALVNALRERENQIARQDPVGPFARIPRLEMIDSINEPSFFQVDVRLYKPFVFGGGKSRGQIFLQVFNLLDRENAGLIEGRAISPNFGRPITLAGPPRTFEVGVRLGR